MHLNRILVLLALAGTMAAPSAHATGAPSFEAICKQTGSRRFEAMTGPDGKPYADNGWSDDPVSSPTRLKYTRGAKTVLVNFGGSDTFEYPVFAQAADSLMFLTLDDGMGTNANVYALSLTGKSLVYSHAQILHVGMRGVMGRVFSFACEVQTQR